MMFSSPRKRYLCAVLVSGCVGWMILLFGYGWVRGYLGDAVAVVFLYALLGALFPSLSSTRKAACVFLFAFSLEIIQAVGSIEQNPKTAIFVGSTFDPIDIAVYLGSALGYMLVDNREPSFGQRRPRME